MRFCASGSASDGPVQKAHRMATCSRPDREAGTAYLVAMFHDEASYRKNADDPEQDAWYQRFRALLEADPEWNDGIFESSAG